MELQELFKVSEALAEHEAYQERVNKCIRNIRRPSQGGAFFYMTEMDQFYSVLPENDSRDKIIQMLCTEKSLLIDEVRLRPNRELVEFHFHNSECTCDDTLHILDESFVVEIFSSIRQLCRDKLLLRVEVNNRGHQTISDFQKNLKPEYYPICGMGTGFRIYRKNYHIR